MPLPILTHHQFLIVSELVAGEMAGKDLRNQLHAAGVESSLSAFYQVMGRMEDAKLVKGHYDEQVIDNQIIRERRYEINAAGVEAYRVSCEFYAERIR